MTRLKSQVLTVRLSEKQMRDLESAAARNGLGVSDYVRHVLTLATQSRTIGEWVDSSLKR